YLIESDIAAARAMYNIAQITSQQPTVEFVADCGFDFLLNEILLMIDSTLLDSNSTADPSMLMESACAKIESMGFSVGHRFVERMAQQKPTPFSTQNNTLECVKFLCKDFWTSVFHKQIDKLQTNHRGVFVLKDLRFRWLDRLPAQDERSRTKAMKLLAFPCGLIRGALKNLGVECLVSCDFIADGITFSSTSFNVTLV
ncbi:hypothetical protein ScalyP_jg1305, partial [Parmales sp. scaly parma]